MAELGIPRYPPPPFAAVLRGKMIVLEAWIVLGAIGSIIWNIVESPASGETSWEWQVVFPVLLGPVSLFVAGAVLYRGFTQSRSRYIHFRRKH